MSKGRKALAGTHESRDFVQSEAFNEWMNKCTVSEDAKKRMTKALRFGLGIKEI